MTPSGLVITIVLLQVPPGLTVRRCREFHGGGSLFPLSCFVAELTSITTKMPILATVTSAVVSHRYETQRVTPTSVSALRIEPRATFAYYLLPVTNAQAIILCDSFRHVGHDHLYQLLSG